MMRAMIDVKIESLFEELHIKIEKKRANVFIVGLGYVGLPIAVKKAKEGFNVTGLDINKTKVRMINRGINYIGDVDNDELRKLVIERKLRATYDEYELSRADVVVICVPTPLDKYKQPDLTAVRQASEMIGKFIREGTLIIFESTTYPGTTEEVLLPYLKRYKIGEEVFVAYSPERIDPANQSFNLENTPKIVGGVTNSCTELAVKFLGGKTVKVSSPKVAEMAKIYENTFRWVNIALANEMAIICNKLGIDVWEMIDAAATKPYGFMPFYPGAGVGGHCIPVDPYYLSWKVKEENYYAKMIHVSGEINALMADYVVSRVSNLLNDEGKSLKNSTVLVMGVAYKKNVSDVRESPMLRVIEELLRRGASIKVTDTHVPSFSLKNNQKIFTEPLTESLVEGSDIVLIGTDHSNFDYHMVGKKAKIIFDTRNAMKNIPCVGKCVRL